MLHLQGVHTDSELLHMAHHVPQCWLWVWVHGRRLWNHGRVPYRLLYDPVTSLARRGSVALVAVGAESLRHDVSK